MWRSFGLFDANRSDCNLEKVIIPENTLFYVNQAYLTVLKNKRLTTVITTFWVRSLRHQTHQIALALMFRKIGKLGL